MRRQGFTLVELSIVLVIIGLLIGGILAAESMTGTARISAQISQIQQMDIAFTNFKTKYRSIPGDSKFFNASGDADGYIENSDNAGAEGATLTKFDFEVANYWRHLSLAGYLPDNVVYSNVGSSGVRGKVNVPTARINQATQSAVFNIPQSVLPGFAPAYFLCDFSKTSGYDISSSAAGLVAAITPADALAIDSKIDDSRARAADMTTYGGKVFAYSSFSGCYTASFAYNVNLKDKQCCLAISIGSQSSGQD